MHFLFVIHKHVLCLCSSCERREVLKPVRGEEEEEERRAERRRVCKKEKMKSDDKEKKRGEEKGRERE